MKNKQANKKPSVAELQEKVRKRFYEKVNEIYQARDKIKNTEKENEIIIADNLSGPTFLRYLDEAVWVEPRMFPARLLILDNITKNYDAEKFIYSVIKSLPQELNILESLPASLTHLSIRVIIHLDFTKHVNRFSGIEQFLSDLKVYGLREALGYLYENKDLKIDNQTSAKYVSGYKRIGMQFLKHSDEIQERLESTYNSIINNGGNISNLLDKLILTDTIKYGKPFGNGQKQSNYAKK